MSWGYELWDQYDNLAAHTHRGIEFLDKYGQFIKERCTIEVEYATKLRRLVKGYQPKKKEEDDYQFSSCKAFVQMMNEINDIAGQHEMISDNLNAQVVKEISTLVKEMKDERKKYLHEGSRLQANLQTSLNQLDKSKKQYEKAYKEAEKAQENYNKADADLNLSRAELEKARLYSNAKNQACEESKTEYANQLQKTNELQRLHYNEYMPKVFQQLQDMEERRIACLQNFFKQTADIHRQVLPIINTCLDGIIMAAEAIDPKEDSKLVTERYQSGYQKPDDLPFEDLSTIRMLMQENNGGGNPATLPQSFKNETVRGTVTAGKMKKRGGIFGIFGYSREDYADLPPNQRKKRLQQKIDSLTIQIQQETSTREGLLKMKECYEQNRSMGDPQSVKGQLEENGQTIEKLQAEMRKYQGYLAEVDGVKPVTPTSQKRDRNSISEESLSRSASDSSVCNPNNRASAPGTPLPNHGTSNSPESGIGTSHTSIPDADGDAEVDQDGEFDNNGEPTEYEGEALPVLGTARALYGFDAQSEGSIPMCEGEEFEVVELDQGDGWTRVRRSNLEEGFVPTSYIEIFLYNNC